MPDRATHCPGCHGSGIEMSGVTYAGISEYVGCHECGPECPDDCGCRVGPERHESVALCQPCSDRVRHMLDDHANALYALLDELGERFGAPRCGPYT
jgi:hypothetical protein